MTVELAHQSFPSDFLLARFPLPRSHLNLTETLRYAHVEQEPIEGLSANKPRPRLNLIGLEF